MFSFTGENWVLTLLDQCNEVTRAKLIFIWWRSWHWRNNVIFSDGKCGIQQSANFIHSYLSTFLQVNTHEMATDIKGKKPILAEIRTTVKARKSDDTWTVQVG
jgi:hypothetical protein